MPNISKNFRADDADVTFKSCDGSLFKVHSKYLNNDIFSEGFAAPAMIKTNELVTLPETAKVLELLFQYCYPMRGPSLKTLPFQLLSELAESVEKYQVYKALEPCKERMEDFIVNHPVEIFEYAHKHGYPDTMEKAKARAVQDKPIEFFRHAMATKNRLLVDELGHDALCKEPVTVFKYASTNDHVELAKSVVMRALEGKPVFGQTRLRPEMDQQGALALLTTHIFEVIMFATGQKLRDLMNLAAEKSCEDPDFSLAVTQLDQISLAAWMHFYNQVAHPDRLGGTRRRLVDEKPVFTTKMLQFSQFWEAESEGNAKSPSSYPRTLPPYQAPPQIVRYFQ